MPDDADSNGMDVESRALLYASGELNAEDAAAFERLLGEDQAAREALLQAVQFSTIATGDFPALPDPSYRAQVRLRLRQQRRQQRRRAAPPSFFGQPVLWSAFGAAAAVLMLVVFHQLATIAPQPTPPTDNLTQGSDAAPSAETARIWSQLHGSQRLRNVVAEEKARWQRRDERPRFLDDASPPRPEETP